MKEKTINATIEILGKLYPVRCLESEVNSLQQAAQFLNRQMEMVQDSGKVINLERIAIITALNITHKYLELDQQKIDLVDRINHRIKQLQEKLEDATNKTLQTELIYTANE